MKRILSYASMLTLTLSLVGCLSPAGSTPEAQRTYAKEIATSTLNDLYKTTPEAKEKIENAKGYVVTYAYAIDLFFFPTENGWAIAVDNATGEAKYVKVINIGIGPGLGIAQMRNVYVFNNKSELDTFCNGGWGFDGKVAAVARFSQEGTATVAKQANFIPGADVYKIGERGLIAEAVLDVGYTWNNEALTQNK